MTIKSKVRKRREPIDLFDDQPVLCKQAEEFSAWVERFLNPKILTNEPDHISINQAMLVLTSRYRTMRSRVPKRCRNLCGDRGHVCIFHVWDQAYERLEALESTVEKPKLFKPPKPPPPKPDPRAKIGGIILGLEDR